MLNKYVVCIAGIAMILSGMLFAKGPEGSSGQQLNKTGQVEALSLITVANWDYWLRNDGQSAHTPDGNSGGIYPGGTAATIYQDGLIWGGYVQDNDPTKPSLRVGGQTYRVGTTAGWIVTDGPNPVATSSESPIYRIRRDWRSFYGDDGNPILDLPTVKAEAAVRNQTSEASVSADQQIKIIEQYKFDWENWPISLGAPFYDVNGNGTYEAGTQVDLNGNGTFDVGETEEPGIAGADQIVWFVTHDLDGGATTFLYGSPPIGLEVRTTAWAYNQPGATLGQLFYKQYTILNKSGYAIDSMFVSQWSDPDVGTFTDDLVGTDISRSLGFAYSGFLTDDDFSAFGLPPAAAGYDFFQGPLVDGVAGQDLNSNGVDDAADFGIFDLKRVGPGKINLPQTSFGYFAAGSSISDPTLGDYEGTEQWYNLLNGFIPETGPPVAYTVGFGTNAGQETKFPTAGDPVTQTGDIDAFGSNLPPGDRRLAMCSGPFSMQPGDVQQIVVAVVGGIVTQDGGNNRNAVAQLKLNDDFAQFIFDNLFQGIPSPPAAPVVRAIPFETTVMLDFGSNSAGVAATEKDDEVLGFFFEGYNIYQLPTANSTKDQALKITTLDKVNTITQISAQQFVPSFGDIVTVPVQAGTNTGISRFFVLERDYINDQPLYPGNEYYFAVTGYNAKDSNGDGIVDNDVPEPTLESSFNVISVVPQSDKPGQRRAEAGSFVDIDASSVNSDGLVSVQVIDPTALTGHDYEVTFSVDEDTNSASFGSTVWSLTDATENRSIFNKNLELASLDEGGDLPFADGFQLKVSGPPPGVKDWDIPNGTRRFTFANADFGFEGFSGAIGWSSPAQVFGSGVPGVAAVDLFPVLLVLAQVSTDGTYDANDPNVSYGYRYGRGFGNPPAQPQFAPFIVNTAGGYSYQDFTKSVPLAAYDVSDPDNPRRLAVGHLENNAEFGLVDGKWFPGDFNAYNNVGGTGPREWLWIFNTDYSETPNPDYQVEAISSTFPVAYWLTVNRRGDVPFSPGGTGEDEFLIINNRPNSSSDVFKFTTQAISTSDEVARRDLDLVNVFPNPYYAYNPEETSRFNRFVTFTHLPQRATIRIFTIAGTQVRKIEKDGDSQFQQWNLRNDANLPVASGFYVAHIELPDLNAEKVVKLFIVQGQEILDAF